MQTDPIGDFLTRIRNAAAAKHQRVDVPASKLKAEIARILKEEGYISTFKLVEENKTRKLLRVFLKYTPGSPQRHHRPQAHFPSRRAPLLGVTDIRPVVGGLGISIMTTPKGLMSGRSARKVQARRRNSLRGLVVRQVLKRSVVSVLKQRTRTDVTYRAKNQFRCRNGVKIAITAARSMSRDPRASCIVAIPRGIRFEQKDGVLTATRATDDHRARARPRARAGRQRGHGVTTGFKKDLDIVGVGYRAELKGKIVNFALGKSHPIEFTIPEGIQVAVEKQTHLVVTRRRQGRKSAKSPPTSRKLRPPDPYKQKGVRITGERLEEKGR